MVVHIKKALRLYLDYNVITCTHVLHLLFTIKPQKIVSLNTTTTILTISSERNRPFIRKEPATHISSESIRFGYLPWEKAQSEKDSHSKNLDVVHPLKNKMARFFKLKVFGQYEV